MNILFCCHTPDDGPITFIPPGTRTKLNMTDIEKNPQELKKYNIWAYTLSKNTTSKKFFLNLGFKSFKDNQFVKQSRIS